MHLYEITSEFQAAMKTMEEMELTPEEIKDNLAAIEGEFETKAIDSIKWLRTLDGNIATLDIEIKRMQEMKKAIQNRQASFKEYVSSNMQATGIDKIECPLFKITLRKPPLIATVTDESLLPPKYLVVKTVQSVDKRTLLADLKLGKIEGALLSEGKRGLTVK